jgi:transcription elongation factor Elf1
MATDKTVMEHRQTKTETETEIRTDGGGDQTTAEAACPVCGETFSSEHGVDIHIGRNHPDFERDRETHECEICGDTFEGEYALQNHVRIEHPEGDLEQSYDCPECDESAPTIVDLADHIRDAHPEIDEPYICPGCESSFETEKALDIHIGMKHPEIKRPYECEHCGQRFETEYGVRVHTGIKHPEIKESEESEKEYECPDCGRRFETQRGLSTHIGHAHPGRHEQNIIEVLLDVAPEPITSEELSRETPYSPPTISTRLRKMAKKGTPGLHYKDTGGERQPRMWWIDPAERRDDDVEVEV